MTATDVNTAPVAVVIPCYNAETWIARTVDSALAQTHPRTEVIVVDDGSKDGSVDILKGYGDRIRLEIGPNKGACHARNRGLALTSADYVLFLDADDYFEGEILAGAMVEATAHGADIVLSNMHFDRPGGVREARDRYDGIIAPETFFVGWLMGDYVNPSAILWRAGFVREIGGWDETLRRNQDFDITLRAILAQPKIVKNETGRAIYVRDNPASISRTDSWQNTESRLRAHKGILERIAGTRFEAHASLLEQEIYNIAHAAFQNGHTDLGREALALLHGRGYRRHSGTWAHRMLATVLGLEGKTRLSMALRSR